MTAAIGMANTLEALALTLLDVFVIVAIVVILAGVLLYWRRRG